MSYWDFTILTACQDGTVLDATFFSLAHRKTVAMDGHHRGARHALPRVVHVYVQTSFRRRTVGELRCFEVSYALKIFSSKGTCFEQLLDS